ncbi:MAG TPA: TIGR03557 family F420-dependent LLM class oxidoreductase [Acidimicrobiales bacterium]|nr:TIGR03557 family F420-dependent LLM class oxidoreductase [Acidimicrobiales bacterium]
MTKIGFALSSEEFTAPRLVEIAQQAEQHGFNDLMISDHFHPWTDRQGNSPFVWSVIGGIGSTTGCRVGTGVTCPTVRIHPTIIAQAAATAATMCRGGFYLGVGSGEALNEHILGDKWPIADTRLAMLEESVELMRLLWEGKETTYEGEFYVCENARIYNLPNEPIPVMVSGFGKKSATLAGRIGDGFVSTSPDKEGVQTFSKAGGKGKPVQAMVKMCWHTDEQQARKLIHEIWPNSGLTGELAQELPTPRMFEQAVEMVTEDMAVEGKAYGPDPERYVQSINEFVDAGFTELYVQQIGDDQEGFLRFWTAEVAPRLGL